MTPIHSRLAVACLCTVLAVTAAVLVVSPTRDDALATSGSPPIEVEGPFTLTEDLMGAVADHEAAVSAQNAAVAKAEAERIAEQAAAAEREVARRQAVRATQAAPAAPAVVTSSYSGACSGMGDPNNMACWDRLAGCESGGNWSINTGNGYYGGVQFSLSSWRGVGGTGYPHEHSREEQIRRGQMLYARGGWGHWPGCTSKFGWR